MGGMHQTPRQDPFDAGEIDFQCHGNAKPFYITCEWTESDFRVNGNVLRNPDMLLAGNDLESSNETCRITGGEELFWIRTRAFATHLLWPVQLQI
jgi:hypothetical protein